MILFSQLTDWQQDISWFPDQEARQDKQSGMEAQDSCKSQGKQEWKVARGSHNMKNVDRSGGFDNNYCCITREI